MIINDELLFKHGAILKSYDENDIIFKEGIQAKYYYQIQVGTVKICNTFDDGKEFAHGFPFVGHCFGESYLLTDKPYAINVVALTASVIICLPKTAYLDLVVDNPQVLLDVNRYTAERLHFRYLVSSFLAISDPLIKIQKLLDHLKDYFGYTELYSFQVPFTRNQLASLTGLRVETIIRVIKKCKHQGFSKLITVKFFISVNRVCLMWICRIFKIKTQLISGLLSSKL
ncbi:Crp/Fnr family transcriptional regulator [Chryseobacterium oryzae]|uniref:Crp/Fnr family transcriptional regulator n=2 Tax=Chryseobacterium TaxID=59732 RepID=A0ABY4BEA8_9FLAO|nr:Crp/Fnr family transcriptional regulator [Chryseobacterium oryzae]UOE37490.1 Crp/Fnr family transcriptional regulator [Chryseobacterium oryzae]